jgi:hypothetical protein
MCQSFSRYRKAIRIGRRDGVVPAYVMCGATMTLLIVYHDYQYYDCKNSEARSINAQRIVSVFQIAAHSPQGAFYNAVRNSTQYHYHIQIW